MRRKLLIRLTLGLLLMVGLGVGILFLNRWRETNRGNRELAEVIAEIEATDPRWRWEQILEDYPDIPPEEVSGHLAAPLDTVSPLSEIDRQRHTDCITELREYPRNHVIRDSLACELWTFWEKDWPDLDIAEQISKCQHVGHKVQLAPDVMSTMLG